jgi:hypothetical protein
MMEDCTRGTGKTISNLGEVLKFIPVEIDMMDIISIINQRVWEPIFGTTVKFMMVNGLGE